MAKMTKERILDAALEMFAENGYAGTNMRDLAQSVGLTKSALYKHFQSKEDIWNRMLDEVGAHHSQGFGNASSSLGKLESCEELEGFVLGLFEFTIHDRKVILARKILLTEQFRNERARELASEYFLGKMEHVFEKLFEVMMEKGLLKRTDPTILAFSFVTPIGALVQSCDREPEHEDWAFDRLRAFLRCFIGEYGLPAGA